MLINQIREFVKQLAAVGGSCTSVRPLLSSIRIGILTKLRPRRVLEGSTSCLYGNVNILRLSCVDIGNLLVVAKRKILAAGVDMQKEVLTLELRK